MLALASYASGDCMEVIAHRGASGYLPEHTLAAYALGYGQGAHWIEPDLVLTGDGVPIALHDVTLNRTTNVAEVFAGRARSDGLFYVADFTWAEIRQLEVVESRPGRYPHSGFGVPSFEQVLQLVTGLNHTTSKSVGIYPELKRPDLQPGLAAATLEALAKYNVPVLIQSFDPQALAALETRHPRIQLLGAPVDEEELGRIATYAAGIGLHKLVLREHLDLVGKVRRLGLAVHVYTLRADDVAPDFATFADEVRAVLGIGVDAVFTDHPDQVLAQLACDSALGDP